MQQAVVALRTAGGVGGPLSVRMSEAGEGPRWDSFVDACPDATFFHRYAWHEIMEQVFGHRTHYLVAERGGAICGVLPLAHCRSPMFGNTLVSLSFAVYGGPAADDEETASALIARAEDLAERLNVDHLQLRNRRVHCPDWACQDLYVTFRRAIEPTAEANLNAIPRKQRAMVRKGVKNGLGSVVDSDIGRFLALYSDNQHRHGTPAHGRRYFERLQEAFGPACEVLTVESPDGRPISSVLSFYFRDEVLPYYAGDDALARDLAANDFKYWSLMQRAYERGSRVFDYGRSKRGTGSFQFKKNWGFEPLPLAYEYRLRGRGSIPQHNPSNPRYRAVIGLWRKLPRAVVDVVGPRLVRHLV